MIILRDYQDNTVSKIKEFFSQGHKHVLAQLPTGGGKCLAKGTEILMYDGTIKKVEELHPLDELMGVDSKPRTIKSTCIGQEEMFTITPVKGDSFTVNKSHILSFKVSGKESILLNKKRYYSGDIVNLTVSEYLNSSKTFKHRAKIWRTGVNFNLDNKLTIDPYFLGIWLADGNSKKMSFTFHNKDVEVIDYLYGIHNNIRKEHNSANSHNYHFRKAKHILSEFNSLNLINNKHIPQAYKTSSRKQRLSILAGILDGDGHLHHNSFDWISVSEKLCDDVMFLCRSLGFACYKSEQQKKCGNTGVWGTYYRLNISGNTNLIPTKLQRKKAIERKQKKDVLVTGVKSIESIGIGDYYGFELIGSDRLFMLSDFTVTHNTIIFSYISQNVVAKNKKVLIITDRSELLLQAGGTIKKFDLNPYYIKAGSKFIDHRKSVFIAMSQTLRNRIDNPEWIDWITNDIDLIIIDECHIQEFNYLFESGLIDNKRVIGFTATPVRTGKMRQLGLDYDVMVRGAEVKDLISKKYLVNCDTYDCGSPSMDGVSINAKTGDYSNDSMFKKFNSTTLYSGLLKNYEKITPNQKMIVFCCNVEHAINTALEFSKKGYPIKFIASKKGTPKKPSEKATKGEIERYKERLRVFNVYEDNYKKFSGTRKNVLNWFKETPNGILVNVDILTKGFDEPTIEVVTLYRATTSLALFLQMVGRGSRISDGKGGFTLFDFGGNVQKLGNYDDNRVWSLWHEEKKGGSGVPPLKECGLTSSGTEIRPGGEVKKGCKRLIMASIEICPFCGFKAYKNTIKEDIDLKLAMIKDDNGVSLKVKSFRDMDFEELRKYREIKGHRMSWLWRQLWMRGKENELAKFAKFDRWGLSSYNRALQYCKNKL